MHREREEVQLKYANGKKSSDTQRSTMLLVVHYGQQQTCHTFNRATGYAMVGMVRDRFVVHIFIRTRIEQEHKISLPFGPSALANPHKMFTTCSSDSIDSASFRQECLCLCCASNGVCNVLKDQAPKDRVHTLAQTAISRMCVRQQQWHHHHIIRQPQTPSDDDDQLNQK